MTSLASTHLLSPCVGCGRMVTAPDLHDEHLVGCRQRQAHLERRDPTDEEMDSCDCPERYVCGSCCTTCRAVEEVGLPRPMRTSSRVYVELALAQTARYLDGRQDAEPLRAMVLEALMEVRAR